MTVRALEILVSAGQISPTRVCLKGGRVTFSVDELNRYISERTARRPAMDSAAVLATDGQTD